MEQQLAELGLSRDEAKVYLALLEAGGGPVSAVAKRAGKNRSTCYYTLNALLQLGLASRVERKGQLYYSPADPNALLNAAKRRLELVSGLVPELLSLHASKSRKPRIRYFEGKNGLESIFDDALSAQSEIVGYTNIEQILELIPDQFQRFTDMKLRKRIRTRYLCPYSVHGERLVQQLIPQESRRLLFEVLFVNPKQFPFQGEITCYEGKIAFMSISKNEQLGVLIESESSFQTMRAIFDLAWLGATSFIAT